MEVYSGNTKLYQYCILVLLMDPRYFRASFGTTKYCNFFLRNLVCNNPDCLYLHELGEQDDSFTKEEMQTGIGRVNDPTDVECILTAITYINSRKRVLSRYWVKL